MKILKHLMFIVILFTGIFSVASAHEGGLSFEKEVGAFLVDVGYSVEKIRAGEPVRFDFDLLDSNENEVDFTDVWVNFSEGNRTVFASGIYKSGLGGAGMTFVFPNAGSYTLDVRYQKNGETISQASFPVEVSGGEVNNLQKSNENNETSNDIQGTKTSWFLGILIGLIFGFVLSLIIKPRNK